MRSYHYVYVGFFLLSLSIGSFFSRLPDIQTALGIDKAQLGLTLIGLSTGAFIGLLVAPQTIERIGTRRAVGLPLCVIALFLPMLALSPSAVTAFFVLAGIGWCVSILEVCLNLETDRLSAHLGRGLMSRAHSMWSFGLFFASIVGSLLRTNSVSVLTHLLIVAVLTFGFAYWLMQKITPAPARQKEHQAPPTFAAPTLGMLGLCILVAAPMLSEGAGVDWSLIFMRDAFQEDGLMSGLALSGFTLAMTAARWIADPFIDKMGPKPSTAILLATTGLGLTIIALSATPGVALVGFVILGVGCSAIYPITISAAAKRTDRPAAVNVAALGQSAFVILFLGPPLLGLFAEEFGVRMIYICCIPVVVLGIFNLNSLNETDVKDN